MSGGRFVWRDLQTTDPEAAKAFYTGLFGWELRGAPVPGLPNDTYDMFANAGAAFGGCIPLDPAHGIPPHWISYIGVPDSVDAACERAAAKGGTVRVPPMDIPEVGRFAVVTDPDGVAFSPFSSSPEFSVPDDADPPVGSVSWNEVFVVDEARGLDFYVSVFGWADEAMEAPNGAGAYHRLMADGVPRAGLMGIPGGTGMTPTWVIHFRADDLEASIAKATDLGGATQGPTVDVNGFGRFQWIADPQGAVFVLGQRAG